jgi:hypothetical protein
MSRDRCSTGSNRGSAHAEANRRLVDIGLGDLLGRCPRISLRAAGEQPGNVAGADGEAEYDTRGAAFLRVGFHWHHKRHGTISAISSATRFHQLKVKAWLIRCIQNELIERDR